MAWWQCWVGAGTLGSCFLKCPNFPKWDILLFKDNMSGQWKQDTFGCFSDMGTCKFGSIYHSSWFHFCINLQCSGLCGSFCAPCLMRRNADDLGKNGLLLLVLFYCVPCVPIFILRKEAREKFGIKGSSGEDALCSCFCASCTNCQTAVEIEDRGWRS